MESNQYDRSDTEDSIKDNVSVRSRLLAVEGLELCWQIEGQSELFEEWRKDVK